MFHFMCFAIIVLLQTSSLQSAQHKERPSAKMGLTTSEQRELNSKLMRTIWDNGSIEAIEDLLATGVQINAQLDEFGLRTPLMSAVISNNQKIVQMLINKGALVDLQDICGKTALILAAASSVDLTILDLLVKSKADLDIQANYSDDPFSTSERCEGSINGGTALMYSIADHNSPEFVKELIAVGSDTELKDAQGKTMHDYAKRPIWDWKEGKSIDDRTEILKAIQDGKAERKKRILLYKKENSALIQKAMEPAQVPTDLTNIIFDYYNDAEPKNTGRPVIYQEVKALVNSAITLEHTKKQPSRLRMPVQDNKSKVCTIM